MTEDDAFSHIAATLKDKLTTWDYFVAWDKVHGNVGEVSQELEWLNDLIGKSDVKAAAADLIAKHPTVVKVLPRLIAMRSRIITVVDDKDGLDSRVFDFSSERPALEKVGMFLEFIEKSGLADLIRKNKISNFADYVLGVEVGLDTNARKNRGGVLMEKIVEEFVVECCQNNGAEYMAQASAKKIRTRWGIEIEVDKSSRIIDFAIIKNGTLFFVETNFYGGGGSKLKSTATEYINMNQYWNRQGIRFIWITDGAGWRLTLNPLREYFDKADFLLNLEMLKQGHLDTIVRAY